MRVMDRIRTAFGYDALENNGRRKSRPVSQRSEDRMLTRRQRRQLSSSTRDLQRNFSIAAWAVRKHLDYVSTFTFQANTGDDQLDDDLERFMAWWSKPANCDAAGRLSLDDYIRTGEALATLDGDEFINFLSSGQLQGIEGDRVMTPADVALDDPQLHWEHGVLVNPVGRSLGYAVHGRDGASGEGLTFDRILSAAFCFHHAYRTRYDQIRGVSPMAPAINSLSDVYENFDYALAKAKVAQLFALAFYRDNAEELGELSDDSAQTSDGEEGDDSASGYKVDFGKGPVMLDLEPGDRAEFLESRQPSSEFQQFTTVMIGVALKSLDIPFSFYDESFTNYSGQRQAWIQYDESANHKRRRNREKLEWLTARRLGLAIRDGDLALPKKMTFAHVLRQCNWISRGIPWIDPLKEITADVAAIKAGQLGPETACRERGLDVYKMIDERARVERYAREHPDGAVVLDYMLPPVPIESVAEADAADQKPTGKAK